ncbi:hypothetical protein GmHk_05G012529 [Glycine max]|nr:hypothetical protein GmHk_05G012529 [Glycine max]
MRPRTEPKQRVTTSSWYSVEVKANSCPKTYEARTPSPLPCSVSDMTPTLTPTRHRRPCPRVRVVSEKTVKRHLKAVDIMERDREPERKAIWNKISEMRNAVLGFMVLLEKAAEEFGFDQSGGLTIPCEIETF